MLEGRQLLSAAVGTSLANSFVSNGNTFHDLGLTDIRSHYGTKGQKPGLWHLAFETETEADLVASYEKAVAAGVKFAFTMDHDSAHSIYGRSSMT